MIQIVGLLIFLCFKAFGLIPEAPFIFETTLQPDKDFIQKNQQEILQRARQSEDFWGVHLSEKIKVEVQPVSENPYLFQCARIYDSNRIYAQSPDSLRHLNGPQRKAFNSRCLNSGYADLTDTIIHEYNHILHLRYVGSGPNPLRWVWEGAAQFISKQIQSEATKRSYSFALKEFEAIDLCKALPPEELINEIGGLAISYYESSKPRILLSLAKVRSASDVKGVLVANQLPCLLTREILLGELKRSKIVRKSK